MVWGEVDNQELIQAISHRADVFARGQGFTAEFNVMFEQLITWGWGWGAGAAGTCNKAAATEGPAVLLSGEDNNEVLSWFTHIMSS